jgi:hypothetical protein
VECVKSLLGKQTRSSPNLKYKSHAFTDMAFILLYQYMQQRDEKMVQFSFLFFATFGAASVVASAAVFLLALVFSLSNNTLSFSSNLWIFLFFFPAALAFSIFYIAPKLNSPKETETLPMIIVGYGTYSLASLLILLLGGRSEPTLWALLVLICVSLAMFNTERIFSFLAGSTRRSAEAENNTQLTFDTSVLPVKMTSREKNLNHNKKPIFSIQNPPSKKKDTLDSEEETITIIEKEEKTVIHLGPRKQNRSF